VLALADWSQTLVCGSRVPHGTRTTVFGESSHRTGRWQLDAASTRGDLMYIEPPWAQSSSPHGLEIAGGRMMLPRLMDDAGPANDVASAQDLPLPDVIVEQAC
jgi:hypothetical protein